VIPPFVLQILGLLVRAAVVAVAGYLAGRAHITLSEEQIKEIVRYLTPIVGVVAWSFYSKYVGRRKLLTAASAASVTEAEIEKMVADPAIPNPSVMLGKETLPR
jgi:hypothetical protein